MGFGSPAYSYTATNVIEPRARLILLCKTLSNRLRRLTHATFESFIELGKNLMGTSPRRGRRRTQAFTPTATASKACREKRP
jgi:hypothetical protein